MIAVDREHRVRIIRTALDRLIAGPPKTKAELFDDSGTWTYDALKYLKDCGLVNFIGSISGKGEKRPKYFATSELTLATDELAREVLNGSLSRHRAPKDPVPAQPSVRSTSPLTRVESGYTPLPSATMPVFPQPAPPGESSAQALAAVAGHLAALVEVLPEFLKAVGEIKAAVIEIRDDIGTLQAWAKVATTNRQRRG